MTSSLDELRIRPAAAFCDGDDDLHVSLMMLLHVLSTCAARSTDGAFLTDPKALTQKSLQDLAATAFRQLGFRQLDAARDFVVGEKAPAMSNEVIGAEISSELAYYACRHELAPFRVRYSEDCCF